MARIRLYGSGDCATARSFGGTIDGWLDQTAALYGLCAIEGKWPAKRGDLTPMTRDHLLMCHPAVRLQYVEVADRYPSVVPSEMMETVSELTEHGTQPSNAP